MTELHEPAALIDPDTRDDALEYWEALLKDAVSALVDYVPLYEKELLYTRSGVDHARRRASEYHTAAIYASTARTHFIQTVRQAFGGMEDAHDDEMGRPRV